MEKKTETIYNTPALFPPVVSVLGHVDHGKTTLLDAIRKTTIAASEHGGITQKIGASQIEVVHEGKTRKITFIDTPGHEAFSTMRSQGVNASDIVFLVVAADDGIKPQTQESIKKILESKLPAIVVITKADLPTANLEKVKQQVMREGILLEGLGGDVPYIAVSAKTGEKIQDLLDLVLLVYDVGQKTKKHDGAFLGVVIDSKLDKRRGNVASIVIKEGKISQGDKLFTSQEIGKARALTDTHGKAIKEAFPGDVVEILGLSESFSAGTVLYKEAHALSKAPAAIQPAIRTPHDLASFFSVKKNDNLRVILKTETTGELEAIKESLPGTIEVVFEGQGDISVSDVLLAKDFGALILGFNVKILKEAEALAGTEKVFFRVYTIIYELLDEMQDALLGIAEDQKPLGKAQILASFASSEGVILGIRVLEGRIAVHDTIALMRGEKEVGKARIVSLRKGKQEAKSAATGSECGIRTSPVLDFTAGDMILSHNTKN